MKRGARIGIVALQVATICLVAGCDDDDDERASPSGATVRETAPAPEGYEPMTLEDAGSVAGIVRWVGPRPSLEPLPVRSHAEACGPTQPSVALTVSERGAVANAVISLVDIHRGRALEPPDAPVTIAREGCRFVPHVAAVGVGWPIRFENRDEVLHNLHGLRDGRTVVDRGLPERGSAWRWRPEEAGVIRLVCDAGHGWEQGWLHVFEHPYFDVSDEDGRFRLPEMPPGRYVIRVWHEGWRVVGTRAGRPRYSNPVILTRTLSVSAGQETTVDFELSPQAAEIAGE